MEADTRRRIVGGMIAVGCTQQRMFAEGYRFASFVEANVDASESEDLRELVADARKVLDCFDVEGRLTQGTDNPFVVAAISTLADTANGLFKNEDFVMYGASLAVSGA